MSASPFKTHVVAEIAFLPAELPARQVSPPAGEYRGIVGVGSEHFSVRFFVPVDGKPDSGVCSGTFELQFLFPEVALRRFPLDGAFTVWEGCQCVDHPGGAALAAVNRAMRKRKAIGYGRVTKIVDATHVQHTEPLISR